MAACSGNPFTANCTPAYRFITPNLQRVRAKREHLFAGQSCPAARAGFSWNCVGVIHAPDNCAAQCLEDLQPLAMEPGNMEQNRIQALMIENDLVESLSRTEYRLQKRLGRQQGMQMQAASAGASTLSDLQRNGFAPITASWGLRSILVESGVLQESRALLDGAEQAAAAINKPVVHPGSIGGMSRLLAVLNERLLPIARAYLGRDAELSGFQLFRLPASLSLRDYISGHWHHDRCGRRLKAYLFLQDMTTNTHPTQVAVGSHRTLYYSYNRLTQSRFHEDYIQSTYSVASMLGLLGEGFVFDTNAIHRGLTGSGQPRDALMFEFNDANKSAVLQGLAARLPPTEVPPCPSSGLVKLQAAYANELNARKELKAGGRDGRHGALLQGGLHVKDTVNARVVGEAWHTHPARMPATRALITKCSGTDRVPWPLPRPAQAGVQRDLRPRGCPSGNPPPSCWLDEADWRRSPQAGWAEAQLDRSERCLASICSIINTTTQGLSSSAYELGSLVDSSTPPDVIAAYHRLGVTVHNLSGIRWPWYFNNVVGALPSAVVRWRAESARLANLSVAAALRAGNFHYSAVPDSFLKLWLFNMTQHESILYVDPDTLALRNVSGYFRYVQHHDVAIWQPRRRQTVQAGIFVLRPNRAAFEGLTKIWYEGDYPYAAFGPVGAEFGDDDQTFLAHAFFSQRLLPDHRFQVGQMSVCDNNKFGSHGPKASCRYDTMSLLHKAPAWEAKRLQLLQAAARAGRCANNPELLKFRADGRR